MLINYYMTYICIDNNGLAIVIVSQKFKDM